MSYAIITLGGKQYRVREGERLLVDRLAVEDGKTFTPNVLLVGGDGGPQLDPAGVVVTAKVLGQQRGPKIRIGKYKKRTGYKRHNGFRSALTQIEIESIGGAKAAASLRRPRRPSPLRSQAAPSREAQAEAAVEPPRPRRPRRARRYAEMTVAAVKAAVGSWDAAALTAALDYEQAHGKRKGAIAALESALAEKES